MNPVATFLSLALLTAPTTPTATVQQAADGVHVGDPVRIEISVDLAADQRASFPEWQETWGPAEIIEVGDVQSITDADGSRSISQTLTVVLFETGETTLPPPVIRLHVDESVDEEPVALEPTQPIVVTVDSLLPEGTEIPDPKPPAPPVALTWGTSYLWTAGLLGLACLVLLSLLLRRRFAAASPPASPIDPLTALGNALETLQSNPNLGEAFTGISLHLRRFFGETLSFPAAESTTTEIRLQLRSRDLPLDLNRRTEELLRKCDGVKFARQTVSRADMESSLGEAASIGAATIEAVAPPPPSEEEEAE